MHVNVKIFRTSNFPSDGRGGGYVCRPPEMQARGANHVQATRPPNGMTDGVRDLHAIDQVRTQKNIFKGTFRWYILVLI